MADNNGLADFEVSAFEILDSAPDFEAGTTALTQLYESNRTPEVASVVARYGADLSHKFRTKPFEFEDVPTIAPIKLDTSIEDPIAAIDDWEVKNLELVDSSDDPDYVVNRDYMKRSISRFASEARRDEHATGEGLLPWIEDKAYRFAEGAVGPFARLVGEPELVEPLYERTQRSRDEGIAGAVASGLGAVVPFAVGSALGGPAGGGAVLGAQIAGDARGAYESSMENTGDKSRATASAGLTAAAQILGIVPVAGTVERLGASIAAKLGGRTTADAVIKSVNSGIATETTKATLREALTEALEAQKKTFGNVAAATLGAGASGSAGRMLGNIATNIGLDTNGDITHGTVEAFLSNAIMAGAFSGAHALIENASVEQAKRYVKNAKESTRPEESVTGSPDGDAVPSEEPLFYKDGENKLRMRSEKPPTYEQRVQRAREYEEAKNDYINEEPSDAPFTNQYGEEVDLPVFEDYETEYQPAKSVLIGPDKENIELSTGAYVNWVAKKLGGSLELSRNIVDGAFGAYFPGDKTIKVLRSLGANPEKFKKVLAHEIGHFIDHIEDPRFTRLFQMIPPATDASTVAYAEAKNVSMAWRSGWDGSTGDKESADIRARFAAYRNDPKEIYADVFSAFVNNPEFVREQAPNLYRALETNLAKTPELNELFSDIQRAESDPDFIQELDWNLSRHSRERGMHINMAERLNKVENNKPARRLQRALDLAYQTVFDRYAVASRFGSKLSGPVREKYFEHYNRITAKDWVTETQQRVYDAPLKSLFAKSLDEGIEPNMWAQYTWDKRLLEDTTEVIENVKGDFNKYYNAAKYIRNFLGQQKGVKHSILESEFDLKNIKTPDELSAAFARLGIVGDTAEIYSVQDFLYRYDPSDPQALKKATRDYNRAVAALNRRKESIPIAKLKQNIETLPEGPLRDTLEEVTRDNAFAVRKYLVNPGGRTVRDAEASIGAIQRKLGPEKFKVLQGIDKEFHDILGSRYDTWEKSGVFTPEMMTRIRLNKSNYATAMVLNYYTGDDSIDGSIRSAVGTLSDIGNELSASVNKIKAVDRRVTYQTSANAAVDVANMAGLVVEKRPRRYQEDIFSTRDKLSKDDKDHSYLVTYESGKPFLNKISGGKGYENMFKKISDHPVLGPVLTVSDLLSKALLTRQLKTVFNPAFVTFQKFYDRRNEAIIANSFEVTGGLPIHTSPKLRGFDKNSRAEIQHFLKTGDLTGNLKTVVDENGAALGKALMEKAGLSADMTGEDAAYKTFGAQLPDENSFLEKVGEFTEKQLDKVGGKFFKTIAEFDELRTKLNGYQIGKSLGMSDAEAIALARERFGVPDPKGGGTAAPLINRMFLFGVAHFNGLRNLGTLIKQMPKTVATQAAYRIVLPKMLVIAPIMGAVMKQAFGQEEADKYEMLLKMIPSVEKAGKNVIPLGFQDGQGNYINFFDADPKAVQSDWKAWYIRMPQARELTAITKVLWPLISNLGQGEVTKAVSETTQATASTFVAGVQPSIQYLTNLAQIAAGGNPTDFFRMKGILREDVVRAGSLGDKFYDYSKYAAAQQAPAFVPYNPFATSDPKGTAENVIQKFPVVGPMVRSFLGVSNYGMIEASKDGERARERIDTSIKLSTGDATQTILNEYRIASGQISTLGKGWKTEVGPDVANRIRYLNSWHSKIWLRYRDELRAAMEADDDQRYQYLIGELEKSSKSVLPEIRGLSSSVEKSLQAEGSE